MNTKYLIICLYLFTAVMPLVNAQETKDWPLSKDQISKRAEMAEQKERSFDKSKIASEETRVADSGTDVLYYSLHVRPDPVDKILYGKVEITARILSQQMTNFYLDCWEGLQIDSVYNNGNAPISLSYTYNYRFNIIDISLQRPYLAGEIVTFVVEYHGKPQDAYGSYFGFDQYGANPMIWTLSEPFGARTWWPCKDTPSDKADSMDIRITVPNYLTAVSNGLLYEKTTDGALTTWWWHEKYPITTYLVSLAISDYEIHYDNYLYNDQIDTMKIHFYTFPGSYTANKSSINKVKKMIAVFSEMFGEYPFVEEKYGQADYLGGGAMEHQTCSSFSFWGEEVFAHELAHQWWGDLVTCNNWGDIWLNEGFATYAEALWFEHEYVNMTASDYQMAASLYLGKGTVYVEDPINDSIFDWGLSYAKGSWVLHMLRHVVGDATFFTILKKWAVSPGISYGTAVTSDFHELCEQESGMDLEAFFHQWIYEEGYPMYSFKWNWERLLDGKCRVFGTLNQLQSNAPIFVMPVDLTITTITGDTTFVLSDSLKSVEFEYIVDSTPFNVQVDKDNWILKTVTDNNTRSLSLDDYYPVDLVTRAKSCLQSGESAGLLIKLQNTGIRVENINATLETLDPYVEVLDDVINFQYEKVDDSFTNTDFPFRVQVQPGSPFHIAHFKLTVSNDYDFLQIFEIYIAINSTPFLFVNREEDSGSFTTLLDEFQVKYNVETINADQTPQLEGYPFVVWSAGSLRENSLPRLHQEAITVFLNAGGHLLMSGSFVGNDLLMNGGYTDSLFFAEILHSRFLPEIHGGRIITGKTGDVLGDGLVWLDASFADAADFNEVLEPTGSGIPFLYYSGSDKSAGIYYFDTAGTKLVVLSFDPGRLTISSPKDMQALFLERICAWLLNTETHVNTAELTALPVRCNLFQNYPNPFNPQTRIEYDVPEPALVQVNIFNVNGSKVCTLLNEFHTAGNFAVTWDGRDDTGISLAAGIYFCRLTIPGYSKTIKMALLR